MFQSLQHDDTVQLLRLPHELAIKMSFKNPLPYSIKITTRMDVLCTLDQGIQLRIPLPRNETNIRHTHERLPYRIDTMHDMTRVNLVTVVGRI